MDISGAIVQLSTELLKGAEILRVPLSPQVYFVGRSQGHLRDPHPAPYDMTPNLAERRQLPGCILLHRTTFPALLPSAPGVTCLGI